MVFRSHLWALPKFLLKSRIKMLKSATGTLANVLKRSLVPAVRVSAVVPARRAHGGPVESDEEFDCRLGSAYWRYYVTENDNNPIRIWFPRIGLTICIFLMIYYVQLTADLPESDITWVRRLNHIIAYLLTMFASFQSGRWLCAPKVQKPYLTKTIYTSCLYIPDYYFVLCP